MEQGNETDLKIILQFQKIIRTINKELETNREDKPYFSIEQILLHNPPSELYKILGDYSPTYVAIYNNPEYENIMCMLDFYINKIYRYYDSLMFTGQNKFDEYVSFSKEESPGRSYTREDLEMNLADISNTIGLLNEAIRLWYEVYQNKIIVAEFSDGEIQEFKIKEGELAHLFGIIWSSLKNNEDLKKMGIVIPDTELTPEQKYDILLKIVELYDKGNLLQHEEDRMKKMIDTDYIYKVASLDRRFDFYKKEKALLPYPKINIRTKAFIDYRPLDKMSMLLDFKKGVPVIKKDGPNVKNTILLSKNNFSDKFNWVGMVSTKDFDKDRNYMRSLLIKSPDETRKYLAKLSESDGQGGYMAKESITTRIMMETENGGSSGGSAGSFDDITYDGGSGGLSGSNVRIFSDQEQLAFIDEVLNDFRGIRFDHIIEYYRQLNRPRSKGRGN